MNTDASIFTKIINREIPAEIVFEDEEVIVIKDIHPKMPFHLLGITTQPFTNLHELLQSSQNKELLWHLFQVLANIATKEGLDEAGYTLKTNNGSGAGQEVFHLHVHLLSKKLAKDT